MKKCVHKCRWKKTGAARYTDPLQEEMVCVSCGKKRWKEGKGIERKELKEGTPEWEAFRKKFLNGN
jgi:hypothetical protein